MGRSDPGDDLLSLDFAIIYWQAEVYLYFTISIPVSIHPLPAITFNKEVHMPCGTKKPAGGKKPPKK